MLNRITGIFNCKTSIRIIRKAQPYNDNSAIKDKKRRNNCKKNFLSFFQPVKKHRQPERFYIELHNSILLFFTEKYYYNAQKDF